MTVLDQFKRDVPLGTAGRLMGLRVIPPELHAGEKVLWSERANRLQHKLRAVGGRVYLTNQRLIFGRSRLESLLRGEEWSTPLTDIAAATAAEDLLVNLCIEMVDGKVERFRIANRDQSVAVIDAARRRADTDSNQKGVS